MKAAWPGGEREAEGLGRRSRSAVPTHAWYRAARGPGVGRSVSPELYPLAYLEDGFLLGLAWR